jgi:hypothetical protein
MDTKKRFVVWASAMIISYITHFHVDAQTTNYPHPVKNPESTIMLAGAWVPENPHEIDFFNLPKIKSQHAVVSNVSNSGTTTYVVDKQNGGVNQHNYLIHHDGKFWLMWSDGPQVEDKVGQRVAYSTSLDGLIWEDPAFITPFPENSGPDSPYFGQRNENGFRWIARGFWVRNNELIALASIDEADQFFGPSLELRAFTWNKANSGWEDIGVVYKDAINNFPPKMTAEGNWMMSRRPHNYKDKDVGVDFLVGGIRSIHDWKVFPVLGSDSLLSAEEPYWWLLPDGKSMMSMYRDNNRSGFLYRAFSTDNGRTWSKPVRTNFPDTASKFHGIRLSNNKYVLVSNARPQRPRDPLVLSISDDGLVFTKMAYLIGGRWLDYPHTLEHEGYLYVAFSGAKQTIEVLKIKISDIDEIDMSQIKKQDKS